MKTIMKTFRLMFGLIIAGLAMGIALPLELRAQISSEDFNALRKTVEQLADKVQRLEQTHTNDTLAHQKDMEQIQQLREKLGETQRTVANVEQQGAAAAQVQPLPRVPLDEATVNHNFSILGDAEVQYAKTSGQHGSFVFADFAPIFLYRGGDRVLFEAGFDFALQNNTGGGSATTINLSFAQLDYIFNDYMTLVAGAMVLPLGTYSERTAGWLNKIPDDPMARDLLPGSGVGAQLRGAIPIGQAGKSITYSVWGVNGPSSADGTGNADQLDLGGNVGLRTDNAVANLHGDLSGGARVGLFLPFKPHYDLEVGLSGQSGEWDNAGHHNWSAGVFDASLHLGSSFDIKGEYIRSWYGSDDHGNVHPNGWWVQAGYKLAGLDLSLPVINNLELVNRYDTINDGLGGKSRRYTVGYIYYFSNTLLFEGDYEFLHSNHPAPTSQLIFQLSYGF
jgi:hypothetical protein